MRLAHVGAATAILATLPTDPVESAVLARKHDVPPGPIILAQTMRIVLVVVLIPPVIVVIDGRVADPVSMLRGADWSGAGAVALFVFGLIGAIVMKLIRMPNPFFLGVWRVRLLQQ